MAGNVLNATISADGSSFTKTLGQLEKQLKAFQAAMKTATSPESLARLNRAADATRARIDALRQSGQSLNSTLGANTAAVSRNASTYQNLGRVIQDLPFGFTGIQNNLTQLIPSVGLLGLAFSGIVAAVTFAQTGLSNWTRGLDSAKKTQDAAAESAKQYAEAQRSSAEGLAKQVVEIESLVRVAKGDIGTKAQQAAALEKLNKLIPDNIGVLTKQNIVTAAGTEIIRKYTAALEDQAVAELLRGRIAGLRVQKDDQRSGLGKELAKIDDEIADYESKIKKVQANAKKYNIVPDVSKFTEAIKQLKIDGQLLVSQYQGGVYTIDKELDSLRSRVDQATAGSVQLELDEPKTKKGKTAEQIADETIAEAKKIADYLNDRTIRQFPLFEVDPTATPEEKAALLLRAKNFVSEIDKSRQEIAAFIRSHPIKSNIGFALGDISGDLGGDFRESIAKGFPKIASAVQKEIAELTKTNPILIQAKLTLQGFYDFEESIRRRAQDLRDSISSSLQNAFTGLGDVIGAAFSGQDIGGPFLALIGDLIVSIGKALVKAGGIKEVIDKILAAFSITPGAAVIAAGLAAIAVGTIIKSTQVKGQRAFGGSVTGGSPYLVGERGREVFIPNTSGRIVPNSALGGSVSGRGAQQIYGQFRIAGNDLIAVVANTSRSQRRLS